MTAATCHPDRPARQRGMCGACYERARRRGELPPITRIPTCHPERPHHALGLCKPCYGERRDRREERLNQLYGMSRAEFDALAAAQGGRCAICRRKVGLVVDHDHETGLRRGLLCNACNRALGFFEDNPAVVEAAVAYLRRDRAARSA